MTSKTIKESVHHNNIQYFLTPHMRTPLYQVNNLDVHAAGHYCSLNLLYHSTPQLDRERKDNRRVTG